MPTEATPTFARSAPPSSPTEPHSCGRQGRQRSPVLSSTLEDLPPILTLKQTAKLLAVDRRTIYSQIRNGKLRVFKVGNAYRIERDSLLTFIRADRLHSKRR